MDSVCSPPPCGEGLGVGVPRLWRQCCLTAPPPSPNPPPQGGREHTEFAARADPISPGSALDEAHRRRTGAARRRIRPGSAMGHRASDQSRRIPRRRRHGAGDAGPHHGRHRVAGRRRGRMAGTHGGLAGRATTGADSDHHRSARHRLRGRASAQAAALDARPRAPRHRRVRGARRADDQYLHQLPDDHAAGAAASTSPMATPVWSSTRTACAARARTSRAGRRR